LPRAVKLQIKIEGKAADMAEEQVIKTACYLCLSKCGLNVHVKKGKIVKVEGMPEHLVSQGYICPKAEAAIEYEYSPRRLKYPMKRRNGSWKRISWDEALDTIVSKLQEIKTIYGAKSLVTYVGGPLLYDIYPSLALLRRFLDVYGSPNYFSVDSMCYRPRVMTYFLTSGMPVMSDIGKTNLVILWGHNPDASDPLTARAIRVAKEKGAKLVVIDPRRTPLAKEADIHIQLRPGTDGALSLGMLNVIISEGLHDREFVDNWTVGFEKLADHIKSYTPEEMGKITWVPAEKIREIARLYGTVKPACIVEPFNTLNQITSGFQACRANAILQAVTGNVDVPGGLMTRWWFPLRPFRIPEMMETKPLWQDEYPLVYSIWDKFFGEGQGMDLPDAIVTGNPYPIKAMIIAGSNPALTWPNTERVVEVLKRVDFLVVMDAFMTETAELADLLLPAATFLEKNDICVYARMANYIMLRKKVTQFKQSWSDAKFWLSLAKRMGYEHYFPWKDPEEFLDYSLEPQGLTVKMLTEEKAEGIMYEPLKPKAYEEKGFSTPSGKVEIYSQTMEELGYDPLPTYAEPVESSIRTPEIAKGYPLILTTGARVAEFLHTQLRDCLSLRRRVPDPVAEINPETAKEYDIKDGDMITVSTRRGSINIKARVTEDIIPQVVNVPHGWAQACCNYLTMARPGDPITGISTYKALLCEISKKG